jgi:hypothetical protein
MIVDLIRFASLGGLKNYIDPQFHFTYYGFQWVKPLGIYLFTFYYNAALFVALGFKYKQVLTFFLSFTYIELMDKTTYLNHYYFITIISLVLVFYQQTVIFQ